MRRTFRHNCGTPSPGGHGTDGRGRAGPLESHGADMRASNGTLGPNGSRTAEAAVAHTREDRWRGGYGGMEIGSLHFLRDLKRSGASPATLEAARVARWRLKNGLEHRTLVALLHAPEVVAQARCRISPADFLTPAYAALAAVILDAPEGASEQVRARAAIAGRPYLPSPADFDWTAEAAACVAAIAARRERWTREVRARRR